jgi:hypothetical protein
MSEYTTVPKAAAQLGMSADALRRWIDSYPTLWPRTHQPYPGASWRVSVADLRTRLDAISARSRR